MLHTMNAAALVLGWIQIIAALGWLLGWLGYRVVVWWEGRHSREAPPAAAPRDMNAKAALVARAREQHGSLSIQEPDGTLVPLVGLEELGGHWPPEIR